jgi:hypothetical protein
LPYLRLEPDERLCTHLDRIEVRELPHSVDVWCYLDEVTFVLEGFPGTTRIPPSPLLS